MKRYCMDCRHSGKVVGYHRTGRRKNDREPILKCEKYRVGVLCTEIRECFEREEKEEDGAQGGPPRNYPDGVAK